MAREKAWQFQNKNFFLLESFLYCLSSRIKIHTCCSLVLLLYLKPFIMIQNEPMLASVGSFQKRPKDGTLSVLLHTLTKVLTYYYIINRSQCHLLIAIENNRFGGPILKYPVFSYIACTCPLSFSLELSIEASYSFTTRTLSWSDSNQGL